MQRKMQDAVSIHAPAKGATENTVATYSDIPLFQSTLPRRERPLISILHHNNLCFNPRSREGSDKNTYDLQTPCSFQSTLPRRERLILLDILEFFIVSIHAPTKGATAISAKNSFQFSAKSTNYHFIYLIFPFSHPLFFLHSTSFVHILECESPGIFMSASYSHSYIITKSMYHLLQFRDLHPYVPPLSDTYFPDNRTSGCQRSHQ